MNQPNNIAGVIKVSSPSSNHSSTADFSSSSAHKSRVAAAAIRECGYELPRQTAQTWPQAIICFQIWKRTYEDEDKDENFYNSGIVMLRDSYSRCITANGEYFE